MARGMLDEIMGYKPRDLRQEELDEDRRISDLAADPFKAMAATAYGSARDAGRALGETAAYAFGKDPRTPAKRHTDAVEAAKAQVAQLGLDPDDPKSMDQFYRQVIMILQKQGLAAEALAVGKEYQAQKRAGAKEDLALREQQRKEDRDKRANELGILRIASQQEIAAARNATSRDIAEAKLTAEQLKDGPFKAIDYNDRVEVMNRHGEVVSIKQKGAAPEKPMTAVQRGKEEAGKEAAGKAYAEHKAGLQQRYDAVVALHNHPGVEGITGRLGRLVGEEGAAGQTATTVASGPARAALALYKQVVGGTFLAGLAKLKEASKTGATGLGAVTEREGDKVQSDAAALDRAQDAGPFRSQLATYAEFLKGYGARLDAAAQGHEIAPVPLNETPLQAPARGRQRPAPAAAPAPAAPAGGWTPEKERRYQELLRKQNAS